MIDEHKSLSEKFLKKGFWLYLFSFIIAPTGYIIRIIMSESLSVSDIGLLYGIISMVILLGTYNDLGLTEGLKYFIPKYIIKKDLVKAKSILIYSLIVQFLTGISISILLLVFAENIAELYFKSAIAGDIIKIFSIYFLINNLLQILSTFIISVQNTFHQKLIEFFRMYFILGFTVMLWVLDIGNIVLFSFNWLIGLVIGIITGLIIFVKKYYIPYFKGVKIIWSKTLFKKVFSYSILAFIGTQAGVILSQMDIQMVILFLGIKENGYYSNYLSIIGIPFILLGPILGFLFPVIAELYNKGENKKITTIKNIFSNNFIILGIIFNSLLFTFGEQISFILFGAKFIQSGVILKYSSLLLVFNFLLQINFSILSGIGKIKERVSIILKAVLFNFVMNIIFIKTIGAGGAALATALGWILIYVLSEKIINKTYKFSLNKIMFIKNILLAILLNIFSYFLVVPLFEGLNRIKSLLYIILFTIIYSGFFAILNKKEIKEFIGEIKKLKKS